MQTKSQKSLKILSILVIVFAVLGLVASVLAMLTGGAAMWAGAEALEQGIGETADAELAAGGGFVALFLGGVLLLASVLDIIIGAIGLGVAKSGRRVKLFIGLCIFGLICCGLSFVGGLLGGSFEFTTLVSIIIMGLALYFALNIKKELANQ